MDNRSIEEELHYKLLKLQDSTGKYVINSLGVNDGYSLNALEEFFAAHLQAAVRAEHFRTHCVTCDKYNKIERPEDEDICQCE